MSSLSGRFDRPLSLTLGLLFAIFLMMIGWTLANVAQPSSGDGSHTPSLVQSGDTGVPSLQRVDQASIEFRAALNPLCTGILSSVLEHTDGLLALRFSLARTDCSQGLSLFGLGVALRL